MHTILGIETSCDETAAAIVRGSISPLKSEILSNVVHSQIDEHAAYGGVVPEIAARAHVEKLDTIIARAMADAKVDWKDIDAIAATSGPGLIGGLIVGVMTAKTLARVKNKPYYAINHLEGHALTARLTDGLAYPHLLLLVSGGHTQILLVRGLGEYERWATTIDDALGEAFDKTAKLLGLPYPGGPAVEKAAKSGNSKRFDLPVPLKGADRPDFSFSGLKTALRRQATALGTLSEQDICDLCACFQSAVLQSLEDRIARSLVRYKREMADHDPTLVVAGGVAANLAIRDMLQHLCVRHGFSFLAPPMGLCSDNGAMIAWAGLEHLATGHPQGQLVSPRPRWPLDDRADPIIGSGKKGAKA
ncbi:MAG: tRNA (adenosine(37)-N6)-threonylcarbamoyltransferase complex transferase subunit TsaD [Altererythrobacter sp.]|nr:tRNA (adenosine(37)-N6)-threonylcarbamoyltransferase complex transferase subunit TsaD [Altererythrobacter sp.]